MRATIKDVAKLAGVSTATVSNVLTERKAVSTELKVRVCRAMEQLNYKPNSIARSLKTNQSYMIGVIVPDILNPFFAEVLKYIGEETNRHGYQMVIYDSGEDAERERKLLKLLIDNGADGIINITSRMKEEELSEAFPVPVVLGDRSDFPTPEKTAFVRSDNFASGKIAAEHLAEKGYKDFVCIAGPVDTASAARRRLEGFKSGLKSCGFSEKDLQVFTCSFSFDDGYRVMSRFLDTYDRTSRYAVYASSDIMAWGVIEACKSRKLRIPEDIAVIGNDNIWCSRYIAQGLTTVENSACELGRRAAELLLDALAEQGIFRQHNTVLEPHLCIRTTT